MDLAPADPVERFSDVELRVERARRTAGFVLAPLVFVGAAGGAARPRPRRRTASPPSSPQSSCCGCARRCRWRSPPCSGRSSRWCCRSRRRGRCSPSFADPVIFVFIGGFMLAEAMFVHGLDRRIAFTALASRFVGSSAARALVVYGAVTTFISMWISNVATTAMMYPIGLAMAAHVVGTGRSRRRRRRPAATPAPARSPAARALRPRHDADHVVRRLGRRPGDAGRHAAEPDRHRPDRARRRPPDHLPRVDRARRCRPP